MSNNKKINSIVLTCALVIAFVNAGEAFAQSEMNTGDQINAANALVRDGKFTEAIDAYSDIAPSASQEDQLSYNLGIAHYRNGDTDAAATLFSKSAGSINQTLASNSQFNLGNCHYSKALQIAESDKPAAISNLEEAISFYRGSLRSNPNNSDARANIELAVELMKELKDEQQQDQQNQDQQNQDQQNQDQQNQDQQNQDQENQDQQNQDQQNQDQQNQDQENQESSENSDSEKQSDDSQQPSEQKNSNQSKAENSQDPSNDPKSENDPSDHSKQDESTENQESKDDASDQANTRDLPKQSQQPRQQSDAQEQNAADEADSNDDQKQPVPSGELEAANQQDQLEKPGTVAARMQEGKDGLMTREEALKMLQSVRDRDMLRRLQQQQRERSRRQTVDRDW